ncbi:protein adenylyltransferase SelO [Hyphococcus sp.]|uniref:protein adenylyltransferase SelO n=1 Tax=Hyphococcus sp. TaxID=2038636 RepID=UPI003CCC3897
MAENYRADTVFARLGDENGAPHYDLVEPAEFPEHILRYRNQRWAARVGLASLSDDAWIRHFGRFEPLPDNLTQPLAIRYHGHQFRTYNPDIGDGRGFLYAQLRDDQDRLLDLGTKGSGQTPYSRFGDGRLTLKGGVREILATEMLEALGVYTSKSFSLIETGEALQRQDEPSPTRSSVLVRLSHSHVRFGVFQRLAFEKNENAIAALIDYCIENYFPALSTPGDSNVIGFYTSVIQHTARLVAQWMAAGFVHGVLNTDNMNVTGESFDYGPWRFAPTADPGFTAAYFDQTGLYSFGRQAEAGAWNLAQLGGALAQQADVDALNKTLQLFSGFYETAMADAYFERLGLKRTGADDFKFVVDFLKWMTETGAPYEQVFFDWFCGAASVDRADHSAVAELYQQEKFASLKSRLLQYTPINPERLESRYFQNAGPCTMLIDEVEAIWAPIAEKDDWSAFERKLEAIAGMRDAYQFNASRYA